MAYTSLANPTGGEFPMHKSQLARTGRENRRAASIINLPDAWVEDARNLNNTEQLLRSANGILEETPAITDFLRDETNKRIVVAPKGYGKTFLLKSKRILLQTEIGR